jgi:hypothetical protein
VNARFDAYVTESNDFSGNRIPGLAPYRIDALGSYSRGPAFVEVRGLYQDEVPTNDADDAAAAPYFLADLRIGLIDAGTGATRVSPLLRDLESVRQALHRLRRGQRLREPLLRTRPGAYVQGRSRRRVGG